MSEGSGRLKYLGKDDCTTKVLHHGNTHHFPLSFLVNFSTFFLFKFSYESYLQDLYTQYLIEYYKRDSTSLLFYIFHQQLLKSGAFNSFSSRFVIHIVYCVIGRRCEFRFGCDLFYCRCFVLDAVVDLKIDESLVFKNYLIDL